MKTVHTAGKLAASAPKSGFDGIRWYVQDYSGFSCGKFQHDAQDEHGAENR